MNIGECKNLRDELRPSMGRRDNYKWHYAPYWAIHKKLLPLLGPTIKKNKKHKKNKNKKNETENLRPLLGHY